MELDESVIRGLDGARRAGWRAYYELKESIGGLDHEEVRALRREVDWLRGIVAAAGLDTNQATTEPTTYEDGVFLPGSGFVRDRHHGAPVPPPWHPPLLTWEQKQRPLTAEGESLKSRALRIGARL